MGKSQYYKIVLKKPTPFVYHLNVSRDFQMKHQFGIIFDDFSNLTNVRKLNCPEALQFDAHHLK